MSGDARAVVCVQGLGYVGAAMAMAIAQARDSHGAPRYDVIGVDLPTPEGERRIRELCAGRFPFRSGDAKLEAAPAAALRLGNFTATADLAVYKRASIVIVDVPFHIVAEGETLTAHVDEFLDAIGQVGSRIDPECLVIVESTVPPGTCERLVWPALRRCFEERGLAATPLLAHSYERVMPGDHYLDSITHFWRVYAGADAEAASRCAGFLETVIHVEEFPLTRLHSTTASETAKALENSYRVLTIALMEEWGRFAEQIGVDLYQTIDAIRTRPTHSNLRQPGFGVGGYCLTKDPLLAPFAARELFGRPELEFPLSLQALRINRHMPIVSLERVQELLGGSVEGRTILLLGVSYREDVGDTRYSPAEVFVRRARERGAAVICHDPYVRHWSELEIEVLAEMPAASAVDAAVLAVPHRQYRQFDWVKWAEANAPLVFDASRVLSSDTRRELRERGCCVESIGRGTGL
jgi:UDP-N-acetyl-D-glucosamine dehydrogenase